MCQAIVKKAGVRIYRAALARAWESNPDSGGFAWREEDGTVKFKKGYRDFGTFWKDYREHQDHDVLIHFRLATHGSKCIENCQPFVVADNCVMAHNGILNEFTGDKSDRSDSRVFAEDVMDPVMEKFGGFAAVLNNPVAVALIERSIDWSKLVFLSSDGFTIINEAFGEWASDDAEGGRVWWSSGFPDKQTYSYKTGKFAMVNCGSYGAWWEGETPTTESSASWEAFLKKKYPDAKIIHNPVTGAPQATVIDVSGETSEESLTMMLDRMDTCEEVSDVMFASEDSIELAGRMPRFTNDQLIDAYIRNKEDDF